MILFVDKDTTLFPSSSIRYRGWLYADTSTVWHVTSGITTDLTSRSGKKEVADCIKIPFYLQSV